MNDSEVIAVDQQEAEKQKAREDEIRRNWPVALFRAEAEHKVLEFDLLETLNDEEALAAARRVAVWTCCSQSGLPLNYGQHKLHADKALFSAQVELFIQEESKRLQDAQVDFELSLS